MTHWRPARRALQIRWPWLLLCFALLGVACGSGGSRDEARDVASLQEELARITGERDRLAEELAAARTEGEVTADEATTAAHDSVVATEELERVTQERDTLGGTLALAEEEIVRLESQLEGLVQEVESLRLTYDDEIRADLQALIDLEVARACVEAQADYASPIEELIRYEEDWTRVLPLADAIEQVEECAGPLREELRADETAARFASGVYRTQGWSQERLGVDDFSFEVPDADAETPGYPTTPAELVTLAQEFCSALIGRDALAQLAVAGRGPDADSEFFEEAAYGTFCPEATVTVVSPGTHLVGIGEDEVQPGTYRSRPGVSDCYWERTAGNGSINANDFVGFAADGVVVVVSSSDASVDFGCGPMALVG